MKTIKVKDINKKNVKKKVKLFGSKAWQLAKSEEALGALKIAAATVALIHAVEEFRLSKKKIGFRQ